jgi:hypothetical protein
MDQPILCGLDRTPESIGLDRTQSGRLSEGMSGTSVGASPTCLARHILKQRSHGFIGKSRSGRQMPRLSLDESVSRPCFRERGMSSAPLARACIVINSRAQQRMMEVNSSPIDLNDAPVLSHLEGR